jgi:DNA-directed RNA polymerase subunit RPC12/RpoP
VREVYQCPTCGDMLADEDMEELGFDASCKGCNSPISKYVFCGEVELDDDTLAKWAKRNHGWVG